MLEDYFKTKIPEFNIHNTLPVARPGLPFILGSAIIFIIFCFLDWVIARNIFIVIWLFTIWFFRDPNRPVPPEGFGLSPADGKIIRVDKQSSCPVTNVPAIKISIFMNIFSVHVNRAPLTASIIRQDYFKGAFFDASFDKSSLANERNSLVLETNEGRRITVIQIAGFIARRIVSWVNIGETLERGQRFGMIRFGSRLDIYLPVDAEIMVTLGQNVSAGWSPIWRFPK